MNQRDVITSSKRTSGARGRLALVGNPNSGKSVLFGLLTGHYVVVSNYPGTTVEISRGEARVGGRAFEVVDTPGANSLIPASDDERVARDHVLDDAGAVVLQVVDAKNLARSLMLTLQLAEMERPVLLALNLWDEALSRGIRIDAVALAQRLGIPVVPTVAIERLGLESLRTSVEKAAVPRLAADYGESAERFIAEVVSTLGGACGARYLATAFLASDAGAEGRLRTALGEEAFRRLSEARTALQARSAEPLSYRLACVRAAAAEALTEEFTRRPAKPRIEGFAERLGNFAAHPVWARPTLVAVLLAMYYFVGRLGAGTAVDFLQNSVFGGPDKRVSEFWGGLVWYAARAGESVSGQGLFYDLFFDDKAGLISVGLRYAIAIVLPIVAFFFIFFGLLEDSGYLPRLAATADRVFKRIGLSGKAALPMVLGLGCGTMAVMTSRILETRKQRFIAILLLTLGVPCSAQLGISAAVLAKVSPWAVLIYIGVVLGVIFTVGAAAARVVPGEAGDFLIEIPPMRVPSLRNLLVKTWHRIIWYLKEAVPLFLVGTFVLFIASRLGFLAWFERAVEPVAGGLLGLPREAAQGFLVGFLRRDYGAVKVFDLFENGTMSANQALVALTVITLFVPCLAQFLMIAKEQRLGRALGISVFVVVVAVATGAALNTVLMLTGADLSR